MIGFIAFIRQKHPSCLTILAEISIIYKLLTHSLGRPTAFDSCSNVELLSEPFLPPITILIQIEMVL